MKSSTRNLAFQLKPSSVRACGGTFLPIAITRVAIFHLPTDTWNIGNGKPRRTSLFRAEMFSLLLPVKSRTTSACKPAFARISIEVVLEPNVWPEVQRVHTSQRATDISILRHLYNAIKLHRAARG